LDARFKLAHVSPDGYRIVKELDRYCGNSLDPAIKELINLRASLINGCTFCVDQHSVDLQREGMHVRKIFSVTTWRESSFFTDVERMALELTEAITNISGGVTDELWHRAREIFSEEELGDVILAIGSINILNRIGISTQLQPPPLDC
jgi:AhpD family alkylhydroperoxidase